MQNRFVRHYYDADKLIAKFGDAAVQEARRRGEAKPEEAEYWHRVAAEIGRRQAM